MRISRKALGVAMGMVMLGSQTMPVLADGAAPSTTGGTANILDYKVETVVVPTTLKIALNPKGYDITMKYVKAASYDADAVYYTEASGVYTEAEVANQAALDAGTFYTAMKSNNQVVSLNYGIVSKATEAKNVKASFAVTYTPAENKKAIEFVDSEAKAQPYDATNNATGAKKGEHKIYLAVASASALPTANTYKKTEDTTLTGGKTYYTKGASGYEKVAAASADDLGTYYEATTAIGIEITAAELSDVNMTKATAGNQAFAKGTTNKADASIAYGLGAATYALKDGETIDFDTTQSQLADKLEMNAIGGVAGFTLTGTVNADADWTAADTDAITITPTYAVTSAAGTEPAVENTYNQVNLGPNLTSTEYAVDELNSDITVTVNNLGDETIASVVNVANTSLDLVGKKFAAISGSKVTITSAYVGRLNAGDSASFKITTSGGTDLTFKITKPAPETP